jgi:thymidylate synthase
MINIIVAVGNHIPDKGWPMGRNGAMPWNNKADLKWFKDTTTGHPVIMGRKTYEAIGHPLKNRTNIVVTTSYNDLWAENAGVRVYGNLEDALKFAKTIDEEVFIIGGSSIYNYALEHDLVDRVYIDLLAEDVPDADTFFPNIITDNDWDEIGPAIEIENRKAYAIQYVKIRGRENNVDSQYLNLVNRIIKEGAEKDTRAGKTRSLFGEHLRFNLKEGLPMLTTKKMFSKGVIHELLWFLKGDTNIKYLVDNGVHIWDDDAYRHYLTLVDKHNRITQKEPLKDWFIRPQLSKLSKEEFMEKVKEGAEMWIVVDEKAYIMSYQPNAFEYVYKFGDLGPVYGHQWRNWLGVDQVKEVVEKLRNNPDDRRIMISAWNVGEIKDMALPPCHYTCQFYTKKLPNGKRELSCMWQQRSVDTLLGLPFNILSYAILTHIIAQCVDMEVGELIFSGGDVHVYENQIEEYERSQKNNNPHMYALPTLVLNPEKKEIDDFKYEDIKIEGYKSYPTVKYPLSVGL